MTNCVINPVLTLEEVEDEEEEEEEEEARLGNEIATTEPESITEDTNSQPNLDLRVKVIKISWTNKNYFFLLDWREAAVRTQPNYCFPV